MKPFVTKTVILLLALFSTISFAQQGDQKKIGLVLSGGGAKGYAHIGLLKAIDEAGLKVDYVAGTSMGAIIGGLYAAGYSGKELEELVLNIDFNELFWHEKIRREKTLFDKTYREKFIFSLPFDDLRLRLPTAISRGQASLELLSDLLLEYHEVRDFADLPIPFFCMATDLETGESVILDNGFLPEAMLASGAYPSLLDPVEIDGRVLVDGGIKNNMPVLEMKELGVDYVIAVDLGQGLYSAKEIQSIARTIEQIISFGIYENLEKQRNASDLWINPDLKGFSVTSFSAKEEILNIGKRAATEYRPILDSLAFIYPRSKEVKTSRPGKIVIESLQINGLNKFSRGYIKGVLGLEVPQAIYRHELSGFMDRLYSTNNFSKLEYDLVSQGGHSYKMNLNVEEAGVNTRVNLGLHYDDTFRTAALVGISSNHFLFTNSFFNANAILGDNLRYSVELFQDNGLYPSVGFTSRYSQFQRKLFSGNNQFRELEFYDFEEAINQIYLQSTLLKRYALGFGMEHQYLNFYSELDTNPTLRFEQANLINFFGFLHADNLDNRHFPTDGVLSNAVLRWNWNQQQTLSLDWSWLFAQRLKSWAFINLGLNLGTYFETNPLEVQQFYLGGVFEQTFGGFHRFYGLPVSGIAAEHFYGIRLDAYFRPFKKHYIRLTGNTLNTGRDLDDLINFDLDYSGWGIGYSYDSPAGPLSFIWSYSPEYNRGLLNFNLGFWF